MRGPQHYEAAEEILEGLTELMGREGMAATAVEAQQRAAFASSAIAQAQVHATLALAAATVANNQMGEVSASQARVEWLKVIGRA